MRNHSSSQGESPERVPDPVDGAWQGIELCRRGDWQEGLYWLSVAVEATAPYDEVPGLLYAYLGYGVARFQGQAEKGLKLCQQAVEMELYEPESYYFLALTHLLLDDRRAAFSVVERGLEVDAGNAELVRLKRELGDRRRPVLRFLPRRHFLNRCLGWLRHRLLGGKRPAGDAAA